jgi:poly-gamma-glutamate synthesis protein (capsule biosynthesis protein)
VPVPDSVGEIEIGAIIPSAALVTATLVPSPTIRRESVVTEISVDELATPTVTAVPVTRLLFTGVIVPARCVQAAIDERGDPHYLYAEVSGIIQDSDLAIGVLNATLSDISPHTGCVDTYVLVGGSENADALESAGFDILSVATNHIVDCGLTNCGNRAFFETLENLERVGVTYVGAGANHDEAIKPVVVSINGVRFGFVSLGQKEPNVFAGENKPGIAILNEENLREAINVVSGMADVVIAMPHWGPEDVPNPNWSQRELAQIAVEAGADVVVGNHTHVVQAVQEIDGVPVFYGLGNFVFDQRLRDHKQGVILILTFRGSNLLGYEMIPTHVDKDGTVHIADQAEAKEILDRIAEVSENMK